MIETAVLPNSLASEDNSKTQNEEQRKRTAELRKFGLLLAALFVVFGEGVPALKHHAAPLWPWILSGCLALSALVSPAALDPLQKGWTKLGHILGAINTRILLGVLYFVVIVPIAIVLRRLGLDKMNRAYQPGQKTYRIMRETPVERVQLERTF